MAIPARIRKRRRIKKRIARLRKAAVRTRSRPKMQLRIVSRIIRSINRLLPLIVLPKNLSHYTRLRTTYAKKAMSLLRRIYGSKRAPRAYRWMQAPRYRVLPSAVPARPLVVRKGPRAVAPPVIFHQGFPSQAKVVPMPGMVRPPVFHQGFPSQAKVIPMPGMVRPPVFHQGFPSQAKVIPRLPPRRLVPRPRRVRPPRFRPSRGIFMKPKSRHAAPQSRFQPTLTQSAFTRPDDLPRGVIFSKSRQRYIPGGVLKHDPRSYKRIGVVERQATSPVMAPPPARFTIYK